MRSKGMAQKERLMSFIASEAEVNYSAAREEVWMEMQTVAEAELGWGIGSQGSEAWATWLWSQVM